MNWNPSWQQVALFAVLLAAIIASHVWAPTAAAAVVSLASTVVGYVFGDASKLLGKSDEKKGG